MDGKETTKNVWKKTGFGILFVAACFIAMYILMAFHDDVLMVSIAAVLLLISAFLFLSAVFSDKAKKWAPQEEESEVVKEATAIGGDGEFRLKITKHMKEMESTQKELIDVLKNQNTLLQTQIENLEHEIYMLSEKQINQTKSVIKFNKENARQLAISERETLEYVMTELKRAIEDKAGTTVVREMPVKEPVAAEEPMAMEEPVVFEEAAAPAVELEEVSGAELFEVSDLQGDDEYVIPDMPEDIDISELFDIPELQEEVTPEAPMEDIVEDMAEEILEDLPLPEVVEDIAPMVEETVAEEPAESAPEADPLASLSTDPNAMMTPEDIARLLAAMGQ